MNRQHVVLGFVCFAVGCGPDTGGVTADLVFGEHPDLQNVRQQELRPAALPEFVARLEIRAIGADGSTLGATLLDLEPAAGEEQLFAEGGTWQIDRIAAQDNVMLRASARVRGISASVDGAIAYIGVLRDISVSPGVISDVGPLVLEPAPVRIPEVDFDAPRSPTVEQLQSLPEGEGFEIGIGSQAEPDLAGWVVLAAATSSAAPTIARGTRLSPGDMVGTATVQAILPPAAPQAQITGLVDGTGLEVYVYAFDDDGSNPLNYSRATERSVTIRDTVAPGPFVNLSLTSIAGGVQVTGQGPGEDGVAGTPAAYEVRTSLDRTLLEDPLSFPAATVVAPPPPVPAGGSVDFSRSYAELGVSGQTGFHVGVRALDAGGNAGPTAVLSFAVNASVAPQLDSIEPAISVAGAEVRVRGLGFGVTPGTVTVDFTETSTLSIVVPSAAWTDSEILLRLPVETRSGILTVTPPGRPSVSGSITVIRRLDDVFESQISPPFAFIGTGRSDNRAVSALYREQGFNDEGAIIRFYDGVSEDIPFAAFNQNDPSTAIGGDYDPALDTFLFVGSTPDTTMTTALVKSSTLAATPFRVPVGVLAGAADAVAVEILSGGLPGEVPAMIAFTRQGTLRTATVADARVEAFDGFVARTSTSVSYEGVAMTRRDDGAILLAYRSRGPTGAVLTLSRQAAPVRPDGFVELQAAMPPATDGDIRILAAPRTLGGPQEFFVAYVHAPAGGPRRIRILQQTNYGMRTGYAPFDKDLELNDIGMVIREGEVTLALTAVLPSPESSELHYTEFPISALAQTLPADGSHPGVLLDIAPNDASSRIACTRAPQRFCSIAWIGPSTRSLFTRR